jgi:hypothetical protein
LKKWSLKNVPDSESMTGNYLELVGPRIFLVMQLETVLNFILHLAALKRAALRGHRLYPISSVIARPAWEAIAEPTLP